MPKVSIIMPTYNRAGLIGNAIKSVLRQTFKNYELIIIDDGSTDNTRETVKSYNDSRIIYVKKQHSGQVRTKNYGIRMARGGYIAYCGDDSEYYPFHLQKLVDFLNSRPKTAMAYTNSVSRTPDIKLSVCGMYFDKRRLETVNFILDLSVMHRMECFDKTGLFDERLMIYEDWDMWLKISDSYPVAHLPVITGKHLLSLGISSLALNSPKALNKNLEYLIKKRIRKAEKKNSILHYIDNCSIAVIKTLISCYRLAYAEKLAVAFYSRVKNYQTLACLGLCNLGRGKFHNALALFKKSLKNLPDGWDKLDPWHAENISTIMIYAAKAYYNLNRMAEAAKICKKALRLTPDNADAKIELARCYINRGLYQDGLALLENYNCNNPLLYTLRGYLYYKNGLRAKATKEFKNAMLTDPHAPMHRHNYEFTKR